MKTLFKFLLLSAAFNASLVSAQNVSQATLYQNVRVFDGVSDKLTGPMNVLISGNKIKTISSGSIAIPKDSEVTVINGNGRTLMPGLIDAHVHLSFSGVTPQELMGPGADPALIQKKAAEQAQLMLMRGFTTARDMAGPVFQVKADIDSGKAIGPRIYPSGAIISQTSGHGDLSPSDALPFSLGGPVPPGNLLRASIIADGRPQVLAATRFNLRQGASQIKLAASGGVSSDHDPSWVTEYTPDELRAGVEAATNFGTYVAVHAYTPESVRIAVDAGVKVIEHGQNLDEATVKYLADKNIWLSTQILEESTDPPLDLAKLNAVIVGQSNVWKWALKHHVKLAWGTDRVMIPQNMYLENADIVQLRQWMTPARALKMVTHDNAELCALSGRRNPYPGKLGVVQEGAYADLLLVDGDPIANLNIIADPDKNFRVIMKDGKIYKNTL
jgi:imidazolonepropionase-like amidohydrolase